MVLHRRAAARGWGAWNAAARRCTLRAWGLTGGLVGARAGAEAAPRASPSWTAAGTIGAGTG